MLNTSRFIMQKERQAMRYCFLRFPQGKFKAVTLSYDDGVCADLRLAEILDRYGIKCTFNINSGFFGGKGKTTPEEIKTHILDKGHEVAVHGEKHIAPGIAAPNILIADVLNCRRALEEQFGMIIRGMAYPDSGITRMHNGNSYEVIRRSLQSLGIVYARTLGGDNNRFHLPEDFYAWMPTAHHKNPLLMEYASDFVRLREESLYSANRFPRLFYLWGHSYEFDRDNNWPLVEEFCQVISNKEDTWYATNMEIYDYVMAYRALVTSADGKWVYNPTLIDVWMNVDGKLFCILSGQTVTIEE